MATTNSSTQPTPWWSRLGETFTKPSADLTALDAKRQARLLATINLAMIFFTGIRIIVGFRSGSYRTDESFVLYYVLMGLTLVSYFLSRTPFLTVSTLLLSFALAAISYGTILLRPPQDGLSNVLTLLWIFPAFLLGAFLLPGWASLIWMLGNFFTLLLFPQFTTRVKFDDISSLVYTVLVLSGVIAVILRYRDLTERDRQQELVSVNTKLR
jgi:hypothetical protein